MKLLVMTAQIGRYHDARYRALARAGVDFSVLAVENDADFAAFLAPGAQDYPVMRLYAGRAAYHAAIAAGRVTVDTQEALSRIDPDVIAVAGWAAPESFAAIAWAQRRARAVVMMSDSQAEDASRNQARELIKARVLGLADSALVAGRRHRDYVAALGMPADRIFLGYDVVDNDHFQRGAARARAAAAAARAQLGLPDRYFIASARFIPKKNLPLLIRAYAAAIKGVEGAPDLVILGDGPERPVIERTIGALDVAHRVHLPGFRSYEELPACYGLSEGFVHVSASEQWGLVINEAAACAVPVIASTACGATPELVKDGVSGFAVDAQEAAGMARALRATMDAGADGRARMGAAGAAIVARWGPDRFARGMGDAAQAAVLARRSSFMPWDRLLLQMLGRRRIEHVA